MRNWTVIGTIFAIVAAIGLIVMIVSGGQDGPEVLIFIIGTIGVCAASVKGVTQRLASDRADTSA
ncbi:MAG: hypothetical protein AAF567_22095 [Actinomycetota bacterium]